MRKEGFVVTFKAELAHLCAEIEILLVLKGQVGLVLLEPMGWFPLQ